MKVSKLWGSQNPTQSDGATAGERELRTTQLCLIYCFIWLLDAAGGTLGEVWRYCNSAASCFGWRWSLELYNLLPHNNQPTDAIIYDTTSSSPAYSSSLLSSFALFGSSRPFVHVFEVLLDAGFHQSGSHSLSGIVK